MMGWANHGVPLRFEQTVAAPQTCCMHCRETRGWMAKRLTFNRATVLACSTSNLTHTTFILQGVILLLLSSFPPPSSTDPLTRSPGACQSPQPAFPEQRAFHPGPAGWSEAKHRVRQAMSNTEPSTWFSLTAPPVCLCGRPATCSSPGPTCHT
jgi:hypothetical protein